MTTRSLFLAAAVAACCAAASANDAYPVFTDPNTSDPVEFGVMNTFNDGAPYSLDTDAVAAGNDIAVFTMDGSSGNNGAGFSIGISNGENGITSSQDGESNQDLNPDVDNLEPVNAAIAAVNGGGKIQNGNAFRLSVWMRQDPNNPVTKVPQIEPVVKFEVWKEALSGNADFNPGLFPTFGDRLWDADQNGGQPLHQSAGQSQASWVDMNNSGTTSFGNPVATSLVTDEWRLVETTLVIDDDPLDDGFGWGIGDDFYTVDDIEEVRAVMFFGDFAGTDLTAGGSIWLDNVLVEVFADEATLNATANTNPMPADLVAGDYNNDGVVDAIDYTVWADGGAPDSSEAGYTLWADNYGTGAVSSAAAIPEPGTVAMLLLASAAMGLRRRG